jgi:hypothetical protein
MKKRYLLLLFFNFCYTLVFIVEYEGYGTLLNRNILSLNYSPLHRFL